MPLQQHLIYISINQSIPASFIDIPVDLLIHYCIPTFYHSLTAYPATNTFNALPPQTLFFLENAVHHHSQLGRSHSLPTCLSRCSLAMLVRNPRVF